MNTSVMSLKNGLHGTKDHVNNIPSRLNVPMECFHHQQ